MEYEAVIGLETHVQLKTKSKMWCGCANQFGAEPNTNVCPVCLGLPGALPVLNRKAVEFATQAAMALNCRKSEGPAAEPCGVCESCTEVRAGNSVDVIAAEAAFRFIMGKLKVIGRIDRLDRVKGNLVRVIDYKTGSAKTQKFADESLQLSIYAMGAQQMGLAPLELVFLNVNGPEEVVSSRSSTLGMSLGIKACFNEKVN